MDTNQALVISDQDVAKISEIIDAHKDMRGGLIPILHEVQEHYGYLPMEVQKVIAEQMDVPLAEIYGVVTFYTQFSLNTKGKYTVSVCLGTACYVKGAGKILEKFEERLGIKAGEVSQDVKFGIEACRCIGACGLAPVVTVNGDVYGRLSLDDVNGICDKYLSAE